MFVNLILREQHGRWFKMSTIIQAALNQQDNNHQQIGRDAAGWWYVLYYDNSSGDLYIVVSSTNASIPVGWQSPVLLTGASGGSLLGEANGNPLSTAVMHVVNKGSQQGVYICWGTGGVLPTIISSICDVIGPSGFVVGSAASWKQTFGGTQGVVVQRGSTALTGEFDMVISYNSPNVTVHIIWSEWHFISGLRTIANVSSSPGVTNWSPVLNIFTGLISQVVSIVARAVVEPYIHLIACDLSGAVYTWRMDYNLVTGVLQNPTTPDGITPIATLSAAQLLTTTTFPVVQKDIDMAFGNGKIGIGYWDDPTLYYVSAANGSLFGVPSAITSVSFPTVSPNMGMMGKASSIYAFTRFNHPLLGRIDLLDLEADSIITTLADKSQPNPYGVMTNDVAVNVDNSYPVVYNETATTNFKFDQYVPAGAVPTVTNVVPHEGAYNLTHAGVVITGTNFTGATNVDLDNGSTTIPVLTFVVNSPTQITATIPVVGSVDNWNVQVTTAGGQNPTSSVTWDSLSPGGLTSPYGQNNYLGEWNNESAVLEFIQSEKWDSNNDGSGTPQGGMNFYDTTTGEAKHYDGSIWVVVPAHGPTHEGGSDPISPAGIGAEPTITPKNSAFNKNFGDSSGDVIEGDDARVPSGDILTADGAAVLAAALTSGSIPFADANGKLAQDVANLFWDDTNNRLGISITNPLTRLHIETDGIDDGILIRRKVGSGSELARLSADGLGPDGQLQLYTSGTPTWRLRADPTQGPSYFCHWSEDVRFGIGTTTPSSELEVIGTITTTNLVSESNVGIGGANAPALLTLNHDDVGGSFQVYDSADVLRIRYDMNYDIISKNSGGTDVVKIANNGDSYFNGGDVGIGTSTPDASAKLEVASTTQGFLPPRMTTVQRDAIGTPATSLMIYNTTTHTYDYYDGANWQQLNQIIKRTTVADANYTILNTDYLVSVTSLTAARTLTLPAPDGKVRMFIIKDESGNAATYPITLDPAGAVTIDNVSSIQLTTPYHSIIIYSNGTNYFTKCESNTGQVKINTGNSLKPTITVTAGNVDVLQSIVYALPLGLSSYPTNKWPQNIDIPSDADVYDSVNTSFIENTIPGQIQHWRLIISFSGKANADTRVRLKLSNPLSGFVLEDIKILSKTLVSGIFQITFTTIADGVSLPPPFGTGHGYDLEITSDGAIVFVIESLTRISEKAD